MFSTFNIIYKAYDISRLYRELKLKGFLTQDKNLVSLSHENTINKINNVSNVSNDQIIPGILLIK